MFQFRSAKRKIQPSTPPSGKWRRFLTPLAWFLVLTALFALAYNQAPLYTSNQNQYFLHGYAQAGYGNLNEDWLANTSDPTPVFSALVMITVRYFKNENLFFVYYAFLMGIYLFSLMGILEKVFPLRMSRLTTLTWLAITILLHSAGLRYLLMRLFGGDWPYLFEGGVAWQRLLGPVFQPSTFGVFLLLSLCLYLRDKKILAVLSAVLAATFHPTYLLSAAALTLAYMVETFFVQKKPLTALLLGLLALAAVSPILAYTYFNFWGGDPAVAATARQLLVQVRIPPHAIVADWFNAIAVVKLIFLGLGLFLVRRSKVFLLVLIPALIAIGLTVVQAILGSDALALIFPWRLSTWLVPLGVGMITAWLVTTICPKIKPPLEKFVRVAGLALIALTMTAGIVRTYLEEQEWQDMPYRPLEAYVAYTRQPGQVYLMPSKLYDFRLEAGVPIYVDFLSIPYRDMDVIEWDRRFRLGNYFYQRAACDRLPELFADGVTHVILPVDFPVECPQLLEVYRDDAFGLYSLIP